MLIILFGNNVSASNTITEIPVVEVYQSRNPMTIDNDWCTGLVRYYRGDVDITGNANTWYRQAIHLGYEVGSDPRREAILVEFGGEFGHVSYVTDIYENSFRVIEQNVLGKGVVSTRTLQDTGYMHFIYFKQ